MKNFIKRNFFSISLSILVLIIFSGYMIYRLSIEKESKPNIILITVDTLRASQLSCYGYKRNVSPNIDAFAKESMLFKKCFSQAPFTLFSFASLFSGFLPHETKYAANYRLPVQVKTLSEYLQENGYFTMAVVSNWVLRKNKGWGQGFDIYDDNMDEIELIRGLPERTAKNTTDAAVKLLNKNKAQSFFLWVHYQDPHGPYFPPEKYKARFIDKTLKPVKLKFNTEVSGLQGIPSYQKLMGHNDFNYYVSQYDSEISYIDDEFERFILELKHSGLYDDALIIFTSDHGESLGERNHYFEHGQNVHNSLIHVPLIIKSNKLEPSIRNDSVQHIDILPTLLKFVGIGQSVDFPGEDLFNDPAAPRKIVSEMISEQSLIDNNLKLVRGNNKKNRLYDLNNDMSEDKDLSSTQGYEDIVLSMKKELIRLLVNDRLNIKEVPRGDVISEDERKKLEALGYVR